MSTSFIISVIVNFGLIILCLTVFLPRILQRYRLHKKTKQRQAIKERNDAIRKVVLEYLKELQK